MSITDAMQHALVNPLVTLLAGAYRGGGDLVRIHPATIDAHIGKFDEPAIADRRLYLMGMLVKPDASVPRGMCHVSAQGQPLSEQTWKDFMSARERSRAIHQGAGR